jgi:SAM-dependent methyltransferase
MKPADWFDARYFGHVEGASHKSNYSRVGGYPIGGWGDVKAKAEWVRRALRDDVLREDIPQHRVLEVGCASGATVRALRDLGIDAYGIDVSEYVLGLAPAEVKPFLACGDMTALLDNPSVLIWAPFSAVYSSDVLEHATEDRIEDILLAMAQLAPQQIHQVNTGEFPYQAADGDQSHFLVRPLVWWDNLAARLGVTAVFKRT